jgi:hypothetical protein
LFEPRRVNGVVSFQRLAVSDELEDHAARLEASDVGVNQRSDQSGVAQHGDELPVQHGVDFLRVGLETLEADQLLEEVLDRVVAQVGHTGGHERHEGKEYEVPEIIGAGLLVFGGQHFAVRELETVALCEVLTVPRKVFQSLSILAKRHLLRTVWVFLVNDSGDDGRDAERDHDHQRGNYADHESSEVVVERVHFEELEVDVRRVLRVHDVQVAVSDLERRRALGDVPLPRLFVFLGLKAKYLE